MAPHHSRRSARVAAVGLLLSAILSLAASRVPGVAAAHVAPGFVTPATLVHVLTVRGTFHAATILRSKVSPMDVVIWFDGSEHYEGLSGGYRFDGASLRDPDGDTIAWRLRRQVASPPSPAGQSVSPVRIKAGPGVAAPGAAARASGLLLLCAHGV